MATGFRVVTDSTADLPPAWRDRYRIEVVPLKVLFGKETFRDGVDLSSDQFFERLAAAPQLPTTSAPSPGDFAEVYERLSRECAGVISIHLGSNLSATCESARVGAQAVEGFRVEVVDSLSCSMPLAFLSRIAAEEPDLDSALAAVTRRVPQTGVLALLDTLRYVQMGGRISKVQYLLGSMLDFKPILKLADGEIRPVERVRTRGRAVPILVDQLRAQAPLEYLAVMHAQAPEEAGRLRDQVASEFPDLAVEIGEIGTVLGTHTGPRALGFVYIKR